MLFQIALPDLSAISGSVAVAAKVKIAHVERVDLYYMICEKKVPDDIKTPPKYKLFHLHKSVVGRCYFISPLNE